MATIPETNEYPAGIYQLEQTDPVLGGAPNEATGAGMDNIPHQQLAKRTNWLKTRVDQLLSQVVAATTAVAGIVQLSTATNSTSTTTAATPSAVKAANDNAETRALKTITVSAGGLATGGGSLAANRTITVTAATQAQAEAGTDNATAMTPLRAAQAIKALIGAAATAAGFVKLFGGTGYIVFPAWLGGLVIQWGQFQTALTGAVSVTFPLAFPNALFRVVAQCNANSNAAGNHAMIGIDSGIWTVTGFPVSAVNASGEIATTFGYYIAIGY